MYLTPESLPSTFPLMVDFLKSTTVESAFVEKGLDPSLVHGEARERGKKYHQLKLKLAFLKPNLPKLGEIFFWR